jgi:hypothetical protein
MDQLEQMGRGSRRPAAGSCARADHGSPRARTVVEPEEAAVNGQQPWSERRSGRTNGSTGQVRRSQVNDVAGCDRVGEAPGKSDPDWKLKQPRIQELVELEFMRRQATTRYFPSKDEAIEMSKKALRTWKRSSSPAPGTRSGRHHDPGARRWFNPTAAVPKTMLEAAKLGLRAMAG